MKLKSYMATLDDKMSEFDLWVTPSLGEIRDTEKFKENLNQLKEGFDLVSSITSGFESPEACSSGALSSNVINLLMGKSTEDVQLILNSVCNVLLLASGKTDNNLKCQLPLMLRNEFGITSYKGKSRNNRLRTKKLPRTITFEDMTKMVSELEDGNDFRNLLIESYIHLVISDEKYACQLCTLGKAYIAQKLSGDADALLSPMVIFQSRGSITATKGHIPEEILRGYMTDWGLQEGEDFNAQDVEVGDLLGDLVTDENVKKRKYDFIIPYQSRHEGAKIFVQSQFYAGDSGSVSHKVVDQTDSTRLETKKKFTSAVFIEYLDGAGYFASLNGDLKRMLAKPDTKDFIQIRTAPIKLRRELQEINFLTTLEIEHAIVRTSGDIKEVYSLLLEEGYTEEEISIAINSAVFNGCILRDGTDTLALMEDRIEIVRKYCLLDVIVNYGQPLPVGKIKGCLLVAGNTTYYGIEQDELIETALSIIPNLDTLWPDKITPFKDLQWLIKQGLVTLK